MKNDYLELILKFVNEAGTIALEFMEDSQPGIKADYSVITKADKAVSDLAHEVLAEALQSSDHILIDEESSEIASYLDQSLLETKPYIWAVDPIDGTRNYANRLPHFGVSIGLLKNLRPYLGAVYFPVFRELFYCDGQASYFVTNAFLPDEEKVLITPIDQEITSRSIFFTMETFLRDFQWEHKDCHVNNLGVAIIDLCWPAIGRGCGSILRSSFWDFAGSWPILLSAGLNMWSLQTGAPLDKLHADIFLKDPAWKLKDYYIISSERNFEVLKGKMKTDKS